MLVARSPSWISLSPLVRAMLLCLILFGQPIGQLNIAETHVVIKNRRCSTLGTCHLFIFNQTTILQLRKYSVKKLTDARFAADSGPC
jgi:hypothetical protein